jgi:hypothetical protein
MELPAPPPEPEFVRDDLLDEDAPTIDVEEFMAGLEEAAINDPAENLFES